MLQNGPQPGNKLSWTEAKNLVKDLRSQFAVLSEVVPAAVKFRKVSPNRLRIYFLSPLKPGGGSTILYSDVDTKVTDVKFPYMNLVEPMCFMNHSLNLSREEQLLNERKRVANLGITSYLLDDGTGRIIVPTSNVLYQFYDNVSGEISPTTKLGEQQADVKINPKVCPNNSDLVAYCYNGDVWLLSCSRNESHRLTFSSDMLEMSELNPVTAGLPSYVIQEEFSRYEGFWWQPHSEDNIYKILYEEIDDSNVDILSLPTIDSDFFSHEKFRFPRPGRPNSKSALRMVLFQYDSTSGAVFNINNISLCNNFALAEYLVRCGWSADGSFIWAQFLDRKQKNLKIVVFLPNSNIAHDYNVYTIYTEVSPIWVSVNNSLHFLSTLSTINATKTIDFLWASEETGHNHLYVVSVQLLIGNKITSVISKTALTSGQWEVNRDVIWYDSGARLVYFVGNKESVLEDHLYVVSLDHPNVVRLLTDKGFTHVIYFNKELDVFLTVQSNTKHCQESVIFKIDKKNSTKVHEFELQRIGVLASSSGDTKPSNFEKFAPDLYDYQISSGDILYAAVYKPHNFEIGRRYPTVLNVYGGPEAQLVTNCFRGMRYAKLHMLASQGFCIVNIDSRGSANRGKEFEAHIQSKFGLVELDDQLEVLKNLNERLQIFDMDRLGIMGWSYGGYLTLMGIANYGSVFKVAVSGAPVVNWLLYDTGYTERYMGLVDANWDAYTNSSVLKYVDKFPDEENRLLIIHGQMDENVHYFHTSQLIRELEKCHKPYQLKLYPEERHSFRSAYASRDYEISFFKCENVCPEDDGFYPDNEQCDKYYECRNGEIISEKLCADGLVFNDFSPDQEKCDLPFNIDCSSKPNLQTPQVSPNCPRKNGYFAHEDQSICDQFFYCVDGKYNHITCPSGLVYNGKTGICTWPDEAKRTGCLSRDVIKFECPKVLESVGLTHPRYPDPEDCQYFYVCINGNVPRRNGCRLGQVFDDATKTCNWPRNVPECVDWYKGVLTEQELHDLEFPANKTNIAPRKKIKRVKL